MLIHPQFDPIAFHLGPLSVRWYGLMYLIAFLLFVLPWRRHAKRRPELAWDAQQIDDMLFYGVLGVVIGGGSAKCFSTSPAITSTIRLKSLRSGRAA